MDSKITYKYNTNEISNISEKGILFSDGRYLDFEECRKHFPYGEQYIAAKVTGRFWQFCTQDEYVVIVCNDLDGYKNILSKIGIINSYDLS